MSHVGVVGNEGVMFMPTTNTNLVWTRQTTEKLFVVSIQKIVFFLVEYIIELTPESTTFYFVVN